MIKFINANEEKKLPQTLKLKSNLWETINDGSIIKDENNINHQIIKLQPAKETKKNYVQILCFTELTKLAYINSDDAKKMNETVNCKDCLGAMENNPEILDKILKRSKKLYNSENEQSRTSDKNEEMIDAFDRYMYLMQKAVNEGNKFIQDWPHKLVMAAYEKSMNIMKEKKLTSMEGKEIKTLISIENIENILTESQLSEWYKATDKEKEIVIEMSHLSIRN